MIKSGAFKLALHRVPSLATALGCDPACLVLMALEQIENPTTANAIQRIFRTAVTENEGDWLRAIREASENTVTGHSLKSVSTILDKYLARTRTLAGEAITRFENARSTEFATRLQTTEQEDVGT